MTEASARTYRFNKQRGGDPFSFNHAVDTDEFLMKSVRRSGDPPLSDKVGRYPGSWTLPVCDASTWGYVHRSNPNIDQRAPYIEQPEEGTRCKGISTAVLLYARTSADLVSFRSARWNWDYTKTPPPFGKFETHPPCICGKSSFHYICVLRSFYLHHLLSITSSTTANG